MLSLIIFLPHLAFTLSNNRLSISILSINHHLRHWCLQNTTLWVISLDTAVTRTRYDTSSICWKIAVSVSFLFSCSSAKVHSCCSCCLTIVATLYQLLLIFLKPFFLRLHVRQWFNITFNITTQQHSQRGAEYFVWAAICRKEAVHHKTATRPQLFKCAV